MGTKIKPSNLTTQVETRILDIATVNSLDSAEVVNLIDAEYVQNLADSDYVKGFIDSDYMKGFVDSDYVKGFVDSDYIGLKIGYTPLDKSGDTMSGTLNVPTLNATTALQINGVNQFSLGNSGDIPVGADLNDQSYRNSAFYSLGPTNKANVNNGVGLYISSYGMGGSNDDATNERAAQIYFGDTPASGMYYRVKQGTAGWHPWVKNGDFAWKEGPTSFSSAYVDVYSLGGGVGSSLDATSSSTGILVNEDGYYYVWAWKRSTGADFYIGLAENGNRVTLESRGEGAWGHDHSAVANKWSLSTYFGRLYSGEKITCGPGASAGMYATAGYAGGIIVLRMR